MARLDVGENWSTLAVIVILVASVPLVYAAFLPPVEIIDSTGDGGGNTIDFPRAIAVDAAGNVYVTGFSTDNAFKITPGGAITEIIDSTGDGGGNTLDVAQGIAVDTAGNVYVVGGDTHNAFKITCTDCVKSGNGVSDQAWKTNPTFGVSEVTQKQIVDDGFTFNGTTFDITDNWHTDFDEQRIKVGDINSFSSKVYAQNGGLMMQKFHFGVPSVGQVHESEVEITVEFGSDNKIKNVSLDQKTEVIDESSINVTHAKVDCSDSVSGECDKVSVTAKFLEPLKDKVMALEAWDLQRRVTTTYLNEGFDISGNSLNPMITKMISGPEKYEGLIEVMQIAKYSDIWISQDDREFQMSKWGGFKQINESFERAVDGDTQKRMDRNHPWFNTYKQDQELLAKELMKQNCRYCYDVEFGD